MNDVNQELKLILVVIEKFQDYSPEILHLTAIK